MRAIENKTAGFSLMEALISIVIGMVIVAAASTMLVNILKAQKDITTSARLNQELGTVMAVMTNEIRRAGFSVCKDDCSSVTYDLGEDIKISDDGKCIEYRYNADMDNDDDNGDGVDDDLNERRGFRLNGDFIQMAGSAGDVKCDDPANSTKWDNLTNSDLIKITALSFTTTGSKCRNMNLPDPNPPIPSNPKIVALYWVVEEVAVGVQTGLACDNGAGPTSPGATTPVEFCTVTVDPTNPTTCVSDSAKTVDDYVTIGDQLFDTRQIIITLNARLTRDSTVSKTLVTAVKVENPWIGKVP